MSDLKRQMSWHDDFTRNVCRFFSRSKSVDRNESEVSKTAAEASMGTYSSLKDPEQHLDTAASKQEPQLSDLLERNSESHTKDSTQGGAGGSAFKPPPLYAPALQPGSTAPPVEGLLRRLGSLFLFSQAEPAGVQRDRQMDLDSSCVITRDSETSAEMQKTEGGVEQQTLEYHSEVTHAQPEEQNKEYNNAVDINSVKELLEEKRHYDLACPPVVTYGTYCGLWELRRQKRKRRMELHCPVSEGQEATYSGDISSTANTMNCDGQEYPTPVNPESHTPSWIQQIEGALTQSDLLPDTETGDRDPAVTSGQTLADRISHITETDSDQLVICIRDTVHRIHKAEQSPLNKPSNSGRKQPAYSGTLDAVSVDMRSGPLLLYTDALMHCKQSSHTQLSDINIDPYSLLPATEQSSKLGKISVFTDAMEHSAPDYPQTSWNQEEGQSELKSQKLAEEESGMDEEVLQFDSIKMVDNILENALTSLQKMEVSDLDSDILLTCELTDGSEQVLFEGADGGSIAEQQYSVTLSGQTPSTVIKKEALVGGHSHMGSRISTSSLGYESIASSDTDISHCVGMASEITTTNVPISSQHEEYNVNQPVLECFGDEREVNETAFCKNSGRDFLPNNSVDNEPLSVNLHIIQKTDITLALPAWSTSLSRKHHMINVSLSKMEGDGGTNISQDIAKNNKITMSCNSGHDLNGDACTIDTDTSVSHQNQTQSLSVVAKSEPFNHSPASDKTDLDLRDKSKMSEIVQQIPAAQSHKSEEKWICCDSVTEIDFLPSETEVPPSKTQSNEHHVHSGGHDTSSVYTDATTQWTSVRAYCCNVINDQRQSPGTIKEDLESELRLDRAEGRTSDVSFAGKRMHLNFPGSSSSSLTFIPQHSRLHELDQVDGGFDIISEEEIVFVNDTGPMYSTSTRKTKTYPFSLSPIFEESVCEEASGQEMLQVSSATEKEQKSTEEPALSILTLLQSVSEKLQSSMICDSDEGHTNFLRAVPRPLWDRYREDCEEGNDNSSVLLHQQLSEAKPAHEPKTEDELCSNIDHTTNEAKDRLQEKQHYDGILGNVGKNASTSFYQCLTSSVMPSDDKDDKHCSAVCHSESNTAILGEIAGFGKFSPRSSIMFIYEGHLLSGGERREIFGDVEDAEKVLFSHGATVHALRGCWLLYADSWFHGSCVLLEEGKTVRTSSKCGKNLDKLRKPNRTDLTDVQFVGSIRTLHKDDSIPEMHLHLSMSQRREILRLFFKTDLIEQYGPVFLPDIFIKSGCWLVYDKPGFSGNSAVLETKGRVTPLLQNSLSCVKSLRPLKMGGLKVMRPLDPKVILYEKVKFQGHCRELLDHTPSLMATEGPVNVSSIQVMGGIWVCFSREGFRGHQRVLEEGQYSDCTKLFSRTGCMIKSLRPIQTDFLEPSICLKSSDEEISVVDLDIPDLQLNNLTQEVKSICVRRGVWVAYSERYFSGEQHVLEKGHYAGALEWGSWHSSPCSLRPICKEVCGIVEPKFLVRVYTQAYYGGECREFMGEVLDSGAQGLVSFRVIRGSWLLFDEKSYAGNQYFLGEGLYPDLLSFGCVSTAIKSLKPIPYSFTDPSVCLFSLNGFEGLKETSYSEIENMIQFFSQSLRVNGGLWVAYEHSHFRGRQMLLQPGEYPAWGEHSGWDTIGSLKSLKQPKVHIQVQNRALGSVLTTEKVLEGALPAKLFLSPAERSLNTQHWIFTDGLFKNTVQRGCLSVIGAKAYVGARVALWEEHGRMNQRWSVNVDGTISSHLNRCLVLDLKGGSGTDRDHLILSQLSANKPTQTWDIDVL